MRLPDGRWLGYCTNVHPYQDVAGMLAALERHAVPLRERLCPDGPLGVGLWFPSTVAREVAAAPGRLAERLAELGLFAFTVNAFPWGAFHGERVKDDVFRPTWAERERVEYTLAAAAALAGLLPDGAVGSVSTHTGAYKPWGPAANDPAALAAGLLAAAEGLARLEDATGRRVLLGLEPEPLAFLETTDELVAFFAERLQPAGEAARRHLGVCFDACHQAVEHEDLAASLASLRGASIPLAKVQLSSAIVVPEPALDRTLLEPLAADRWFHQVLARKDDGSLLVLPDLPAALADPAAAAAGPWRVHYHVPIFADALDGQGRLRTTRPQLEALLAALPDGPPCGHLEIETYTFGALPEARRAALGVVDLTDALEREFRWVLEQLARLQIGSPAPDPTS
jgi:hypothetical protein